MILSPMERKHLPIASLSSDLKPKILEVFESISSEEADDFIDDFIEKLAIFNICNYEKNQSASKGGVMDREEALAAATQLDKLAKKLGVEVYPFYGTWIIPAGKDAATDDDLYLSSHLGSGKIEVSQWSG